MKRVTTRAAIRLSSVLLACCLHLGCEEEGEGERTAMDGGRDGGSDGGIDASSDASTPLDASRALSDDEILGVIYAFNTSQIAVGPAVLETTQNDAVRAYIQAVIAERMAAHARATNLAATGALVPRTSTIAEQIRSQGTSQASLIRNQTASTVDNVYLNYAIMLMQATANNLDAFALTASAPALKTEIATLRAEVTARLQQARALRNPTGDGGLFDAGPRDGG